MGSQSLHDGRDISVVLRTSAELGHPRPAAGVLGPFARLNEAEEHVSGDHLLARGKTLEDGVGPLSEGPLDPTTAYVGAQGEEAALPALPKLEEQML